MINISGLSALMLIVMSMSVAAETNVVAEMDKRLDADMTLACRVSYQMMVKVFAGQSQENKVEGFPEMKLAPSSVYMKDCMALPRMVQKCLVDRYALHSMAACQYARKEYEKSRQNI